MNKVTVRKVVKLANELHSIAEKEKLLGILVLPEHTVDPAVRLRTFAEVDALGKRMIITRAGTLCRAISWIESVEFYATGTVLELREAGLYVPGTKGETEMEYVMRGGE